MDMAHVEATSAPAAPADAKGEAQGFADAAEAVAALEQGHGRRSCQWVYFDAEGTPAGVIVRWDRADGKEIRPVSRRGDGDWVIGGMPEPRPLYGLPTLLARGDERVYVTEGEKAADAAAWLSLLATTSPHGSGSAGKADWRPLAGRDVVILPDNDEAGRNYARAVASILHGLMPPPRVRIVDLPDLPPKGDMFDWVGSGPTPQELRAKLDALVEAAPECRAAGRSAPASRRSPACSTSDWTLATPSERPILQCFADVVPAEIRWLWPGRVPLGRITLLVGRPGEGKSFLTTDLAARVSMGRAWPDGTESVSGSVIFICAEDDPADTLRPRLDAHGADVRRVHLLERVRRTDPDGRAYDTAFTLADVQALEVCLQTHPDCRLVVVDPIGSYLGNGTDAYRDSDVRAILDPVARLADLYGPAVLVVAHRRKDATAAHADDLALGSRAFTGVARSVWHLTRDPQNKTRRLLLPGKNNLAAEGRGLAFTIMGVPPALHWEPGPVDLTANEALAAESAAGTDADTSPSGLRRATLDWLGDLLANGPRPVTDIRREALNAGFSWRSVQRAKDSLAIRSVRPGVSDPWIWQLPAT